MSLGMKQMMAGCAALAVVVVAIPAQARDRHYLPFDYSNDVTVVGGYGGGSFNGDYSPFPVSRPYVGRTVNQEYCGRSPEPCHQYSNTFQPYAPPVFYRIP